MDLLSDENVGECSFYSPDIRPEELDDDQVLVGPDFVQDQFKPHLSTQDCLSSNPVPHHDQRNQESLNCSLGDFESDENFTNPSIDVESDSEANPSEQVPQTLQLLKNASYIIQDLKRLDEIGSLQKFANKMSQQKQQKKAYKGKVKLMQDVSQSNSSGDFKEEKKKQTVPKPNISRKKGKNDYKSSKTRNSVPPLSKFIWQTQLTEVYLKLMRESRPTAESQHQMGEGEQTRAQLIQLLEIIYFGFQVERYIREKIDTILDNSPDKTGTTPPEKTGITPPDKTDVTTRRVHYQSVFDFLEPIIQRKKLSEKDLKMLIKVEKTLVSYQQENSKHQKKNKTLAREQMLQVLADLNAQRT